MGVVVLFLVAEFAPLVDLVAVPDDHLEVGVEQQNDVGL